MSGGRGASQGCAGAVQLERRGPPYLRGLDPGQSDAAVAERRSEPTGPDPRERPSCEEVSSRTGRGGPGASCLPGLPPARGGVPLSGLVAAFPCADCPARPGPRLPRPGVPSCAAFASRLPAFPGCPGRAGHSFPFRSPCRPLPLPAFSRPASRTPLRLPPAAPAPQLHSCLLSKSVAGRGGQGKSRDSFPLGCPLVLTFSPPTPLNRDRQKGTNLSLCL